MRALHLNAILDLRETNRNCKHSVKQHRGKTSEEGEEEVNSSASPQHNAAVREGATCGASFSNLRNGVPRTTSVNH